MNILYVVQIAAFLGSVREHDLFPQIIREKEKGMKV